MTQLIRFTRYARLIPEGGKNLVSFTYAFLEKNLRMMAAEYEQGLVVWEGQTGN